MPLDATVGGVDANSFESVAEADAYFQMRLPLDPVWVGAEAPLLMATQRLETLATPMRVYVPASQYADAHYVTLPSWTGTPATSTQRLSWPRKGMFDRNGNPIPEDVIPQELKNAESEIAGQLHTGSLSASGGGAVATPGIAEVKVSSIAIKFQDGASVAPSPSSPVPSYIYAMFPASWLTQEVHAPTGADNDPYGLLFDVVSR